MTVHVIALEQPALPPLLMPDRFLHDVTYFCTPAGTGTAPARMGEREYWVQATDSERMLDDGVITIVSPLDSAARTEIELTEDQERWLGWMVQHHLQHIRLQPQRETAADR